MFKSFVLAIVFAGTLFTIAAAPAQSIAARSGVERLAQAHSLYYTPTTAGLKSFKCDAALDWKAFLSQVSGKDIADDNAALKYLLASHISFVDDLTHGAKVQFDNPALPPDSLKAGLDQLHDGIDQMFSGFFQTWNAYLNGTMVPLPTPDLMLIPTGDNYRLLSSGGGYTLDELYDKDLILTNVHITSTNMNVIAKPTYERMPEGLVVTGIQSETHQPASAPASQVGLNMTYNHVGQFLLPATLKASVQNVATFNLTFSNCLANPS